MAGSIKGNQAFGGKIGKTIAQSEPWWSPRPRAPDGAPNVIVMLADDLGFSDLACYGSEIATPNLDALATEGLRYVNFHVPPLCSPTRAALLTGRNPHAAGMGMIAQINPGFPGYASELPDNQPSMAEIFRENGYSTMMLGKWHLCRESDLSDAGDKASWPLQRGFEQYYGFLEALTNFHHPHRMYEGNKAINTDQYPEDYYLTDDLTDRAISMVKEVKAADPAKPFFMYFAHGAVHAPLHAKKPDIDKYKGRYAIGWDRLREERLQRQKALGIIADTVELPPRNSEPGEDVVAWESLPSAHQKVFAKYMECYAAMVDNIDQNVGRLMQALDEMGLRENTIFIFLSDNGASREGREAGTMSYLRDSTSTQTDRKTSVGERELAAIETIGGPQSWPHYPRGWGMASNTPFRLYKVTSYRGGNQVPFVISWPDGIHAEGQILRQQYTHVTDLLPTLVELIGLKPLTERHGQPADPIAGRSFVDTIGDPSAPTKHNEQYIEVVGHRAFYRDGWEIANFRRNDRAFAEDKWELFDIENDPNQRIDVSEQYPERLKELLEAWEKAAEDNHVFPLEEGSRLSELLRPEYEGRFSTPVRIAGGTPTLERWRSCQLVSFRSFTVTVEFDYSGVEQGVLLAHGGQEGGYVLYIENAELFFVYNDGRVSVATPPVALLPHVGKVEINAQAAPNGLMSIQISVAGNDVARLNDLLQFGGFLPFEGIDVGIDRRSPVSWDLYERHGPFPYSGRVHAATYQPGEPAADALEERIKRARAIGFGYE